LKRFGPGYYIPKATKPRFTTIWKHKLGETEQGKELQILKKRTEYLTYGFVGVAATETDVIYVTNYPYATEKKPYNTHTNTKYRQKQEVKWEGLAPPILNVIALTILFLLSLIPFMVKELV